MKVKFTYFKNTGKFYSSEEEEWPDSDVFEAWKKTRTLLARGERPGLFPCHPGENEFITLFELPGHPNDVPMLVLSDNLQERSKS